MRPSCALVIIIVAICLFANSVQRRQLWMQPTYSVDTLQICPGCASMYEWLTAHALIHTNNWLQENPLHLRFALFHTPRAIEAQSYAQRIYYGSYPPGAILPLYVMINVLSLFEPDIIHDRVMQLRMIIAWNYAYHLLLVIVLCCIVFIVLQRSGCNNLNATLMACTPAIVQYSNGHSFYWFNTIYSFDQAVLLPCALYVLLELQRQQRNFTRFGRLGQALLVFYGTLTDWLYVFFVLAVYGLRLIEGRIAAPRRVLAFLRESALFFLPSLLAVSLWLYQVQTFSSHSMLGGKLVSRMGLDIPTFGLWTEALLSSMFFWPELGYGASGVVLLYATFYIALRMWLQARGTDTSAYCATTCYLLLCLPCLAHMLFFVFHSWDHLLSSLKLSLPLSVLFSLLPYMIIRANHSRALFHLKHRPIYLTTVFVLAASIVFSYVRSREALRFFSLPDVSFARTGNFIRTNTQWQDVVFSRERVAPIIPPQMQSLAGRVVHVVINLDQVYQRVQHISTDFTIKIFYYPQDDMTDTEQLAQFLASQDLPTTRVEDRQAGALLSFNGNRFVHWYRQQAGH